MKGYTCFGIVGNFAGHLEQAGEATDFHNKDKSTPKGLFPFYIPEDKSFLGRYCIDSKCIIFPNNESLNIQSEPEIAIECQVSYDASDRVINLTPTHFMAFDDTSIRNFKDAKKLSEKKNFSIASKGIGNKIPIDKFSKGGICDKYSLTSFLLVNNEIHQYGDTSKLVEYSLFYEDLIEWIIDRFNNQTDDAVLERLDEVFKKSNYPSNVLIAIGATTYTIFGQERFLKVGDESCVVVFDHTKYTNDDIRKMIVNNDKMNDDISILRRVVIKN